MTPDLLTALIISCAPSVDPLTMGALVAVESAGNPFAIGVVGNRLIRQPADFGEAVATARSLEAQGRNYSVGLAQINRQHFSRLRWSSESGFEPCTNLAAGAAILVDCFRRTAVPDTGSQPALHRALSCYYSGSPTRGLRPDADVGTSYVERVRRRVSSHPSRPAGASVTAPRTVSR